MRTGFSTHLGNIKKALIALDPSGHRGFEGLLAVIFNAITGAPFRLAGSGSQHGKDGSTTGSADLIAFEAKLYTGPINKNEVLSKLTEIIAAYPLPDLWVLGATIEIKTQITDPLTRTANKNGINLLILDWSPTAVIPELAVLCALARDETVAFLNVELQNGALVTEAAAALDAVAAHDTFERSAAATLAFLRSPSLGQSVATNANRTWLATAFSDARAARREFGQPLAPLADNALPTIDRSELVAEVQVAAFGPPSDRIVVLLGDEGCGKTWIFAQSWLAVDNPPLTLVIPASEVPHGLTLSDERDFLIKQIIRQTGGPADQQTVIRWRNILIQWEESEPPAKLNLVVLVDGLNQRPTYAWPQWLDGMAYLLARLGGRLAISVRNGYYANRLRGALMTPQDIVRIGQWTDSELKAILASENIDSANLGQRVIAILCNPRLLGIAFELLRDGSVRNFHELSPEHLLFEHIRKSSRFQEAREEPLVFTRRLSSHASEILKRVASAENNETLIFESADLSIAPGHQLSQELLAVSEGRFFNVLAEDPFLYQLSDDGLVLALGFAILDTLARAQRTGTSVEETLGVMLEPIAALDKTAEAVFAALLIASVDERSPATAASALIAAYLRLQNIDEQYYPAFQAIVRTRTDAAMAALVELTTSSSHASNAEWLTGALHELRRDERCWIVMSGHIEQWLRCYSLDPALGVFKNDAEGTEKYEAKVEERKDLLRERMESLSSPEANFVSAAMHRDDRLAGGSLASEAFQLLAGMPLASHAEPLVAWAFAQAINSDFHRPYDELLHLVLFNNIDWVETRERLLQHASALCGQDASNSGKWALVHVLRATSTIDDAARCEELVEELTRDRPSFGPWRLIENYCETDPCDPRSVSPGNIKATAQKYRELVPEQIRVHLGMSQEDQYLRDASFGLARFEPVTAIEVHRSVIHNVSRTVTGPKLHRLLNLREDTPLVTAEARARLLALAREKSGPHKAGDKDTRDDWLIAQFALLLTLPHIDGDEQLDSLLSLPGFGPPLLDLADILKPAQPEKLEAAIDRCVQSEDSDLKMTILMFAHYSATELSERSIALIRTLADDAKSAVRALAIGTLVEYGDRAFIQSFAEGTWNANSLDPNEAHFERWDGARAIARAFSLKMLTAGDAIDRMAHEHYHMLASAAADWSGGAIAQRIDAALRKTLEVDPPQSVPIVEQASSDPRKAFGPPMKSLAEPAEKLGPAEYFKRLSESEDDSDERQRRGWEAYEEFEAALTKQDARQILQDTPRATLRACITCQPELFKDWAETFLTLTGHKIRNIYNFGLRLAEGLSYGEPNLSAALLVHLRDTRGFINIVHGPASLGLESLSIWGAADHPALDALRGARLDQAKNDNEIAQEVLAALSEGKSAFLERYLEVQTRANRPADLARALIVAGFSTADDKRAELIAAHADLPGIIGKAARSARYAYERNVWARQWYEAMHAADTAEDFWRFSVLFLKIVDGRYQSWETAPPRSASPMESFAPSLRHSIERRIKSWQDKRAKTLFGEKAPAAEFLASAQPAFGALT